eukprot:m.120721 g.120721  ORF g.120721 m.120721 type:complete len:272 (-) comp17250_c0_seq1:295-1110(-)
MRTPIQICAIVDAMDVQHGIDELSRAALQTCANVNDFSSRHMEALSEQLGRRILDRMQQIRAASEDTSHTNPGESGQPSVLWDTECHTSHASDQSPGDKTPGHALCTSEMFMEHADVEVLEALDLKCGGIDELNACIKKFLTKASALAAMDAAKLVASHVQRPECNLQHVANLTAMCVIMNLAYSMEELDKAVVNLSNKSLPQDEIGRTRMQLARLLDVQLHETAGLISTTLESLGINESTSSEMGREIQKLVRFHMKNKDAQERAVTAKR